jgi:GrpB-like predicted nucleotidyltransferase (UPF0157 family)
MGARYVMRAPIELAPYSPQWPSLFAKPVTRPRKFHVHAVAVDDPFFTEHLVFRDALRANAPLAADYFSLKVELANRFGDDRQGYTEAKSSFIRSVIRNAKPAGPGFVACL